MGSIDNILIAFATLSPDRYEATQAESEVLVDAQSILFIRHVLIVWIESPPLNGIAARAGLSFYEILSITTNVFYFVLDRKIYNLFWGVKACIEGMEKLCHGSMGPSTSQDK